MNKKLGIIKDSKFLGHFSNNPKLENPNRLIRLYEYINENKDKYKLYNAIMLSEDKLQKIHSAFYTEQIKKYSLNNKHYNYDKDTYINENTYEVALLAAGGCCALADKIMTHEVNFGFSLVRPPGHHAEIGRALGFCIFNNVALTAQHLIDTYDLNRILIVDFDAHHGNGTQEIFYANDKVLTVSIHQNNLFPQTGKCSEIGAEEGLGYNINIPVHPYFGDEEYAYIFGKIIQQIAEVYLPQIILVSAGFDGHIDDSSSKLQLTDKGYVMITKFLKSFANNYSDGKLLFVLEGGYNESSLYSSACRVVEELENSSTSMPGFMFSERADKILRNEMDQQIKRKWSLESSSI